jgi:gas vesicle protein GvpG
LLIVDKMLVGGIKFVLGKVAAAVEAELNDDSHLREELLAAQMRLELGEMTEEEFATFEGDILARLREIRERKLGEAAQPMKPGEFKVTGVEATANFEKE